MRAATIIIPLLNQVDIWLEQALRSALAQTVSCEVIVVTSRDTGESNREVLYRLQSRAPDLIVIQQPREGFAAGLNCGIQSASAPRAGLLLSDDWLEPMAAEACLGHSADIVSTGRTGYAADGITRVAFPRGLLTREEYDRQPDLERKARVLGHFFLFNKQKLAEVGGFDETLGDSPGIDDYDFIWTMLEHHATVSIVEERLYNYRDHAGERLTTRDPRDMAATMNRILAKHNVTGSRAEELLARHAKWFGRTIEAVLGEQEAGGGRDR